MLISTNCLTQKMQKSGKLKDAFSFSFSFRLTVDIEAGVIALRPFKGLTENIKNTKQNKTKPRQKY